MTIGHDNSVFLGVVVNPVDNGPVFVTRETDATIGIYRYESEIKYARIGAGYLDDGNTYGQEYLRSAKITGYPRCHTPGGVADKYRGSGFGTCLYTGLVLLATARAKGELMLDVYGRKNPGISSDDHRSGPATTWWTGAVDRGLAEEMTEVMDDEEATEETEDDVEITRRMSGPHRRELRIQINEVLADLGYDIQLNAIDSIRGQVVTSTVGNAEVTAQYITYASLVSNHLMALRQTFDGRTFEWAKDIGATPSGADIDLDVLLAMNFTHVDPMLVGKLAVCAHNAGAHEVDVVGMVMREQYGLDLLRDGLGHTHASSAAFDDKRVSELGLVTNPGKHRRNPSLNRREQLLLGTALERLARRREKLGLDRFADLGDGADPGDRP